MKKLFDISFSTNNPLKEDQYSLALVFEVFKMAAEFRSLMFIPSSPVRTLTDTVTLSDGNGHKEIFTITMTITCKQNTLNVPVFRSLADWDEDDGDALFFKLGSGEPPVITSPLLTDFDRDYYTHWLPMPVEFTTGYADACNASGLTC
jgi:hypothetical protein